MTDNENELHKIIVSSNGEIHNFSDKIFSTDVINEYNNTKQHKKVTENIRKSTKKQLEEKISNTSHILSNVFPSTSSQISSPHLISLHDNETFIHTNPIIQYQNKKKYITEIKHANATQNTQTIKDNTIKSNTIHNTQYKKRQQPRSSSSSSYSSSSSSSDSSSDFDSHISQEGKKNDVGSGIFSGLPNGISKY